MSEKFYAVKVGRAPGIYLTWAQCKEQVDGFPGSVYKAFKTREEAVGFAGEANPEGAKPTAAPATSRFYGVKIGHTPGVYANWAQCKEQVDGFPGSVYKAFKTQEEALSFANSEAAAEEEPAERRPRKAQPSSGCEAPGARKADDPGLPSDKVLYVDGGQNKQTQGVAWGRVVDGDGVDCVGRFARLLGDMTLKKAVLPGIGLTQVIVAEFSGVDQQNNGAELLAMVAGLRIALESGATELRSDSELVVKWWSRGHCKAVGDSRKLTYVRECAKLREEFEKLGGSVAKIPGGENLADLGFHRD